MFGLGDPPQQDGRSLRQSGQLRDGIAAQHLTGFDVDQLIAGLYIYAGQSIRVVDALLQAGKVYPCWQAEQPVIRTVRQGVGEHPVLDRERLIGQSEHRQQIPGVRRLGYLVTVQVQQDHFIQANTKQGVILTHH